MNRTDNSFLYGLGKGLGAALLAYASHSLDKSYQTAAMGLALSLGSWAISDVSNLSEKTYDFVASLKGRALSFSEGVKSLAAGGAIAGVGTAVGLALAPVGIIAAITSAAAAGLYAGRKEIPLKPSFPPTTPVLPEPETPYSLPEPIAPMDEPLLPEPEPEITLEDARLDEVLKETPPFNHYRILGGQYALLRLPIRPANLLFDAIRRRARAGFRTTMPGTNESFAWRGGTQHIRPHIVAQARQGALEEITVAGDRDYEPIYGANTYRITYQELLDTLDSQRIYLSPHLPRVFYTALKEAMNADRIVRLPGDSANPVQLKNWRGQHIQALIRDCRQNPQGYGFADAQELQTYLNLTVYQLGAMVVKTEDFRILIDEDGQILQRNGGENDAIRLINMCGIRGIQASPSPLNKEIMYSTFVTSLAAAGEGMVLFPAVGMGVWKGPPDVYWPAFFDAVANGGDRLEKIFVHPMHTNREFDRYFAEAVRKYQADDKALLNLEKIRDVAELNTDIVQLARHLKQEYPEKTISLVNASDPDVTLGNHVGGNVNTFSQIDTTEENLTAMGTNGLCFEWLTGVHGHPNRIIQV